MDRDQSGLHAARMLELRRQGGRWLKDLRETGGLSQRQLAERLHLDHYTFISQLETGRGRIPPDRYLAWAHALGVDKREFVRTLMSYYDPVTYGILFDPPTDGKPAATATNGAALPSPAGKTTRGRTKRPRSPK